MKTIHDVTNDIIDQYNASRRKHNPMRGPHEGYAVILEELDELWYEIKRYPNEDKEAMRNEALHLAAMCLAFLYEVCQ